MSSLACPVARVRCHSVYKEMQQKETKREAGKRPSHMVRRRQGLRRNTLRTHPQPL